MVDAQSLEPVLQVMGPTAPWGDLDRQPGQARKSPVGEGVILSESAGGHLHPHEVSRAMADLDVNQAAEIGI